MSGVKRRTKYRKQVENEVRDGRPEPDEGQRVVRIVGSQGGNLLEVQTEEGTSGLAILPTKFRKLVWVGRGDFVIVSEAAGDIATAQGEGGVRFLVDHILRRDQIKHLQEKDLWPEAFADTPTSKSSDREGPAVGPVPVQEEEWKELSRAGSRLEQMAVGVDSDEEDGDDDSSWLDRAMNRNKRRVQTDSEEDDSSDEDDSDGDDD